MKKGTYVRTQKHRLAMSGENNPAKRPEVRKKLTDAQKGVPKSKAHCESLSKAQIKSQSGRHGNKWIEDRSRLKKSENKQDDTQYKYWRKEVRKRDYNKCRLLNSDCKGRLESHHIFNWVDCPELRYIINNGITLCAFHHPRGREEEKRMVPILQELLSVSKETF